MDSFPPLAIPVSVTNANVNPRWWLACNYDSVAGMLKDFAWEIRGQGVKAMTESELYQGDGVVRAAGKDPAAEKWAQMMTERYNALGKEDPIFTELRNVMDMCVSRQLLSAITICNRQPNLNYHIYLDVNAVLQPKPGIHHDRLVHKPVLSRLPED